MDKIIIKLYDGTQLEVDQIDYIGFEIDGSVTVKGWNEGLNQTLDNFPVNSVKSIRFNRKE